VQGKPTPLTWYLHDEKDRQAGDSGEPFNLYFMWKVAFKTVYLQSC
jgi:hypothetical protein